MSSLSAPPLHTKILEENGKNKNYTTQTWQQWFIALYQALGGLMGVGASFLEGTIADITNTTPRYIAVPRASTVTSLVVCLQGLTSNHIENIVVKNGSNTIGTLVIPANTTAGTVISLNNLSNTLISTNSSIKVNSSALSSNAVAAVITIVTQYLA